MKQLTARRYHDTFERLPNLAMPVLLRVDDMMALHRQEICGYAPSDRECRAEAIRRRTSVLYTRSTGLS